MKSGFRVFFLLLWLILTFACALLLFTKGFLLKRVVVDQTGTCHSTHWLLANLRNGLRTKMRFHTSVQGGEDSSSEALRKGCGYVSIPKFDKAVFVVIDGLRYDFLQHQKDVETTMELPFQNKMKKVHKLLSTSPGNAKLFKFEADPPTTTMQRIKGITTGSLPTFVDAGTNFDSSAITEDNILDHVVRSGKNISFMGCSTWTELFPKHFHRKIPFSALNVKDLDTIDYGIMKNIYNEIRRDDWSLLIAHFLGVDHCGHRYGTHHHEMTRKLTEMDNVISELTNTIDEDTVLFVMGDHGMTSTGDHGGDSSDEVMAGLFVYSKKSMFPLHNKEVDDKLPKVSQIDLVPTLSLLLDIPIPFSNLGAIIPQFFDGDQSFLPEFMQTDIQVSSDGSNIDINGNNMDATSLKRLKDASSNLFKNINLAYASYVNCKQILRYLEAYQKLATDLPFEMIEAVRASFVHLEEQYEQNLEELVVIDWINKTHAFAEIDNIEENVQEMYYLHLSFQNVLYNFKTICRAVWAKFDIVAMSLGLSLMMFVAVLCCLTPFFLVPSSITDPHGRLTVIVYLAGFGFALVGLAYLVAPFEDTGTISFMVFAAASFSFSLWLLSCSSSAIFFLHHHITVWRKKLPLVVANMRCCFYLSCLLVYLGSLFANSYIVHEDTTSLFFVQTFILVHAGCTVVDMLRAQKLNEGGKPNPRGFTYLRTKLLQRLTGSDMRPVYMYTAIAAVALRLTRNFWFCREMQLQCNVSPYSLPLVALMSEFTEGYAHERLFVAFISVATMAFATHFYLKQRGNMKGSNASVVAVKLIGAVSTVILVVHWSLQLRLTDEFSNKLFDVVLVQQIVLPRAVYVLSILSLIWLLWKPLCLFLVRRSKKEKVQEYADKGNVAALYHIMKSSYDNQTEDEAQQRPMVYGLQTVYSASFVSLLFSVVMVTVMLMTDGLAFPVAMLWVGGWCVARFVSWQKRDGICDNVELVQSVIVWSFFASLGFFSSGHQTAISTIRYYAAYIGFKGSFEEMIFQVMAILFNTFAIPLMCALALPLLIIFKRVSFNAGEEDGEDEYLLNEYPDVARINLFKTAVAYLGILMLKVCFSAASASLHRRHLMVWKIFGPRFMFEAVSFLLSSPLLLLGIMYFLRIDIQLSRWKEKLQKQQN